MTAEYSSFGSLLEDLRSLFPAALVGGSGWERLEPLTHRLPVCAADSRFGFEFHLTDPEPTADFFVISAPHTRLADFYRGLTEEAAAGLIGTDFTAFLDEQARHPDSFLARAGKGIILEYDLAMSPPGRYGVPGIFIVNGSRPEADPLQLYEDPAALVAALRSVAGWDPDVAESRHVERACTDLADCGVYVSHAGVMPGRAERAIRLVALGVDGANVAEGLRRVQWPGDWSQAMAILCAFAGLVAPRCGLGITITPEGVLPRLDLELTRKRPPDASGRESFRLDRPGWELPIGRLEERGWCLPAKADGLREWPRLEMVFGRDGVYQVRQIINHFKVVIDRGAVYAKAYAGMDVRRTSQ